jgi:hypothetical protein
VLFGTPRPPSPTIHYNVFIAKYLFTGSVKILNKIVFKIAIKFISMRNPEIS